jgi:hypothetical protein
MMVVVIVMMMVVMMMMRLLRFHRRLHPGDAVALERVQRDIKMLRAQRAQVAQQRIAIHAQAQQRTENHVPAGPAHAVEFQDLHVAVAPSPSRLIRAAHTPAPNPLSTFTTDTPGAQELSMASSGVIPPRFMP